MAVKAISIDREAYELLVSNKREEESFSEVIKRNFEKKKSIEELIKTIDENLLSDKTLKTIDQISKKLRKEGLRKVAK